MSGADNKLAARRVLEEIFPANDEVALRELVSDEFVNHEAPPGTPLEWRGSRCTCICSTRPSVTRSGRSTTWSRRVRPSSCAARTAACTPATSSACPATGRPFSYNQMHMIRMRDGKSVEHWAVRDDAALMRQLTVLRARCR